MINQMLLAMTPAAAGALATGTIFVDQFSNVYGFSTSNGVGSTTTSTGPALIEAYFDFGASICFFTFATDLTGSPGTVTITVDGIPRSCTRSGVGDYSFNPSDTFGFTSKVGLTLNYSVT